MSEVFEGLPAADYYDCRDVEELSFESPDEALEYYVDSWCDPQTPIVESIRQLGSVTMTAYERMSVDHRLVYRAVDHVLQFLDDETADLSNPDSDDGIFTPDQQKVDALTAAIGAIVKDAHVWGCQSVGSIELSPQQIEAWARKECPYWFESEKEAR